MMTRMNHSINTLYLWNIISWWNPLASWQQYSSVWQHTLCLILAIILRQVQCDIVWIMCNYYFFEQEMCGYLFRKKCWASPQKQEWNAIHPPFLIAVASPEFSMAWIQVILRMTINWVTVINNSNYCWNNIFYIVKPLSITAKTA